MSKVGVITGASGGVGRATADDQVRPRLVGRQPAPTAVESPGAAHTR